MKGKSTYCFIVNCASKSHTSERYFRTHESLIAEKLPGSVIKYIRQGESIISFIDENLDKFSHFVACGGDGTVNRVANALAGKNKVMGVIPMGSGNDFATNIGLTGDFETDLSIIVKNTTRYIDVIQADHVLFINTFGIGVDGLTNYYASRSIFKNGFLKYFVGGLKALYKADRFDAELVVDSVHSFTHKSIWMVAVANGKTEGGRYMISPNSDSGDGKAEVVIVKGVSRVVLFIEFVKLSLGMTFKKGIIHNYDFKDTLYVNCSKQRRSHADGEQKGTGSVYNFKMKNNVLPVITGN